MPSSPELIKQIKPAIVAIGHHETKDDGQVVIHVRASGFNIRPSGLVVTCSHVIESYADEEDPVLGETKVADGRIVRGELRLRPVIFFFFPMKSDEWGLVVKEPYSVWGDEKMDIAFISLLPGEFRPDSPQYPCLELCSETQHEGEEIGIAGFPYGDILFRSLGSVTPTFHFGRVSAVLPYYSASKEPESYQLDISSNEGNSGGPVFRMSDGKVIGVLQGAFQPDKEKKTTTGISYAGPASKIQVVAERWEKDEDGMFSKLEETASKGK